MALLVALAPGSREARVELGLCAGRDGEAACEEARSVPDPGLLSPAGAGSAPSPDELAPGQPGSPDGPDPGSSGLAAVLEIEEEPHEDPVVPVLSVYTERQLAVFANNPALGDLNLPEWVRFHFVHCRHHAKQIQARLRWLTARKAKAGV